jgi:hypothetical protein
MVDNTNSGERGRPAALKIGPFRLEDGDVLPKVKDLAKQLGTSVEWISPITGQEVVQVLQLPGNTTPSGTRCSQVSGPQGVQGAGKSTGGSVAVSPQEDNHSFSPHPTNGKEPDKKINGVPVAATLQRCNTPAGSRTEVPGGQDDSTRHLVQDQCSTPLATPCNTGSPDDSEVF